MSKSISWVAFKYITHLSTLYTSLVDSSTTICWTSPFVILRGVGSILSLLFYFWWKILIAKTVDPDQTPHHVASDLGFSLFADGPFTGFHVKMGQHIYSWCPIKETLAISGDPYQFPQL